MRSLRNFMIPALLLLPLMLLSQTTAGDEAGKKLFIDNKCSTCHSIESQQIEKKNAASKAPDLSGAGAKFQEEWFAKYLKKNEAKEGKKHPKAFSGKPEDLKTLSEWLATLKSGESK